MVSHHSSFVVLVVRVELIRERSAPDALPSLARAQRIPALHHKALYISMEFCPIVVATVVLFAAIAVQGLFGSNGVEYEPVNMTVKYDRVLEKSQR